MEVIAFNGSPNKTGNTYYAIKIVADELQKEGINTTIINVGAAKIRGCIGCNGCFKNKNEECIFKDDILNECIQKVKTADGIILGSPTYFAGIGGTMKSFLDRLFYVADCNGGLLRHKVGASVVAVRRAGGVPTFNQLNNYINYGEMLMPSSNYWNVINGTVPGDSEKDEEGIQIMRMLGKNMAWLMKLVQNGKGKIPEPEKEKKVFTNFIR
ncbi:flavodoxin family protein [Clostridium sp. JNZ X4-2]